MTSDLIKKITLYPFDIRLTKPFVISLETITHAQNILIYIQCEDPELNGWGEASPYQTIQGETQATQLLIGPMIAKALIGKHALDLTSCLAAIHKCIAFHRSLKSAFDMALYDIQAKAEAMPLYKFLGGTSKIVHTDMTLGIDLPEIMAESALGFVHQGFTELKIKLGKDPLQDIRRVECIRKAIGSGVQLRIDANQGWNVEEANQVLHAIENFTIDHCEQPVSSRDNDALKKVHQSSPIPIMADESLFDANDARSLISLEACSQFNIKLGKSGGIHEAIQILDMAAKNNIVCQVGCFSESRLAITALTHLALAYDQIIYYDMDSPLMLSEDPIQGGVKYKNTKEMHIDDSPGLGVGIDPLFIKNLAKIEIG